jgi:hypothetical protein
MYDALKSSLRIYEMQFCTSIATFEVSPTVTLSLRVLLSQHTSQLYEPQAKSDN